MVLLTVQIKQTFTPQQRTLCVALPVDNTATGWSLDLDFNIMALK